MSTDSQRTEDSALRWIASLAVTAVVVYVAWVWHGPVPQPHFVKQPGVIRRQTLTPEQRAIQQNLLIPIWERYRAGTLIGAPVEPHEDLLALADEIESTRTWVRYSWGNPANAREGLQGHLTIFVSTEEKCPRVLSAMPHVYVF